MNLKSKRKLRFHLIRAAVILLCLIVARSWIEHKTILDSTVFVAAVTVIVGSTLYVFAAGGRSRQIKRD